MCRFIESQDYSTVSICSIGGSRMCLSNWCEIVVTSIPSAAADYWWAWAVNLVSILGERINNSINNKLQRLFWHLTLASVWSYQSDICHVIKENPNGIKKKHTNNNKHKRNSGWNIRLSVCLRLILNINHKFWPNFRSILSYYLRCFDERIKIRILMTINNACVISKTEISVILSKWRQCDVPLWNITSGRFTCFFPVVQTILRQFNWIWPIFITN